MNNMKHASGKWYTRTKPEDRQGLVCSEIDGRNIAVTYDPKDAAIVAAAPEMLDALAEIIDHATKYGGAPLSATKMFDRARAAVAKAKGE